MPTSSSQNTSPKRYQSTVLRQEILSETARLLVLDRAGMPVEAGKEIMIHGVDVTEDRPYSIASGEQQDEIQVLYRIIPDGVMTPKLASLNQGDPISFTGPFGSFILRDADHPSVFIATGTGIAPAISFIRSHPRLPMTVLHGVRVEEDLFSRKEFEDFDYHPCISGSAQDSTAFPGRVTNKLEQLTFPEGTHYYLCGSNDMIVDACKILKQRGVPDNRIFSEAYFFW